MVKRKDRESEEYRKKHAEEQRRYREANQDKIKDYEQTEERKAQQRAYKRRIRSKPKEDPNQL